jgi:hypothetical protein
MDSLCAACIPLSNTRTAYHLHISNFPPPSASLASTLSCPINLNCPTNYPPPSHSMQPLYIQDRRGRFLFRHCVVSQENSRQVVCHRSQYVHSCFGVIFFLGPRRCQEVGEVASQMCCLCGVWVLGDTVFYSICS